MRNKAIIFSILLLGGCTTTQGLKNSFQKNTYSALYLFETQIYQSPKSGKVFFEKTINLDGIKPSAVSIVKYNAFIVPAIVVNYWQSNYKIQATSKLIKENLNDLIYSTLIKEGRRSGNFLITEDKNESDISVDVSIDSLRMYGLYQTYGYAYMAVFAYGYNHTEIAGPGIVKMYSSIKYYRKGELIYSEHLKIGKQLDAFPRIANQTEQLQRDYAIKMVENFSDCLSFTNAAIIERVSILNKP